MKVVIDQNIRYHAVRLVDSYGKKDNTSCRFLAVVSENRIGIIGNIIYIGEIYSLLSKLLKESDYSAQRRILFIRKNILKDLIEYSNIPNFNINEPETEYIERLIGILEIDYGKLIDAVKIDDLFMLIFFFEGKAAFIATNDKKFIGGIDKLNKISGSREYITAVVPADALRKLDVKTEMK